MIVPPGTCQLIWKHALVVPIEPDVAVLFAPGLLRGEAGEGRFPGGGQADPGRELFSLPRSGPGETQGEIAAGHLCRYFQRAKIRSTRGRSPRGRLEPAYREDRGSGSGRADAAGGLRPGAESGAGGCPAALGRVGSRMEGALGLQGAWAFVPAGCKGRRLGEKPRRCFCAGEAGKRKPGTVPGSFEDDPSEAPVDRPGRASSRPDGIAALPRGQRPRLVGEGCRSPALFSSFRRTLSPGLARCGKVRRHHRLRR